MNSKMNAADDTRPSLEDDRQTDDRALPVDSTAWDRVVRVFEGGLDVTAFHAMALSGSHGTQPFSRSEGLPALAQELESVGMADMVRWVLIGRVLSVVAAHEAGETTDIADLAQDLAHANAQKWHAETRISLLITAIKRLDVAFLRDYVVRGYEELGAETFITTIALPLLHRVGRMWASREMSVAGEHLISATIRAVLEADLIKAGSDATAEKILMTTPYGEQHEIGVLCAAVIARHHGFEVIFTGAQLPAYEVARLCEQHDIRMLCMGGSYITPEMIEQQINQIIELLPSNIVIFTGGEPFRHLENTTQPAVRHFTSMSVFSCELEIIAWLLGQRSLRQKAQR